nr:hypothetical protein [Tanacetum cinerariifolium]
MSGIVMTYRSTNVVFKRINFLIKELEYKALGLVAVASVILGLVLARYVVVYLVGPRPRDAFVLRALNIARLWSFSAAPLPCFVTVGSTLTQEALDVFCQKYHILDDVHPELPAPYQTIHDSPAEIDLFAFIRHADLIKGDQHDNVEDVKPHNLDEGGGDAEVRDQTEESDRVAQDQDVNIFADEDVQVVVVDKPIGTRKKRKVASGTSGFNLPPKKLREDHDTSGVVGASTAGKSVVALQGLLDQSTLAAEVGVTAVETVPFVTSYVTLTPDHDGGEHTDSVSGPNLRTRHPAERFVISSDSSHHFSTNAADYEVTSIVRSFAPPSLIMTAAVGGTSSAPALVAGIELVHASIFVDSASIGEVRQDVTGPSKPARTKLSADTFYVSQEMDSETLQQIYCNAPLRKEDVMS